ncbi:alpha-E domain-containing protein [Mesobacillus foraminis]|uniref:alpha-E domain-containing protein n=1 Tax=Mesobacillus foraminis TaxID=279826 RepID=UPI0039A055E1
MNSTGIIVSSMSRDLPYQLMKIGKWLERAKRQPLYLKQASSGQSLFRKAVLLSMCRRSTLQLVNGYEDYSKKIPSSYES